MEPHEPLSTEMEERPPDLPDLNAPAMDAISTKSPPKSEPAERSGAPPSLPPLSQALRQAFAEMTGGTEIKITSVESPPERLGPNPDCPHCGGHGWVRKNVLLGDPDFGKAFPCACAEPIFRARRLARIFGRAQIPFEFATYSFESYGLRKSGDQAARASVQDWAERGEGSLFLSGPVGRGKTGLAICALRHRIEVTGIDGLYRYVPDLFDDIRRGFDRELGGLTSGEIFDAIRMAGVLHFDDVGKEQVTPWVVEQFNRLIDYRWREHLPTIFTSNQPLSALDKRLGEAAASRVKAMCWPNVLEVRGSDLREVS